MKIGIIGAGRIGGTLMRRLTALGHDVFVANSRGPKTLANLAAETGARPPRPSRTGRRKRLSLLHCAGRDDRPSSKSYGLEIPT